MVTMSSLSEQRILLRDESASRTGRANGDEDPLHAVFALQRDEGVAISTVAAFGLHLMLAGGMALSLLTADIAGWNKLLSRAVGEQMAQTYDVEVQKEAPKEVPKEEPKEEPIVQKADPKEVVPKEAPAPAAAQAGAVLTQAPDPNEPVDLTNTGFVSGSGSTYAGGNTASTGTSTSAVYAKAARADGVVGGTGTGAAVDKSRAAARSGSGSWDDCPFPPEADSEQIDQAYVTLQVTVAPSGDPASVAILNDPGHGFGREAKKCAMRKKYTSALDREGNPVGGTTPAFRVRFER